MKYIKQKDGTFLKEGVLKNRYVNLRIYRNGVWKEPITPVSRTVIIDLLEKEDSKYLPGDIYELIGVESSMTEEDKQKLRQIQAKKRGDMELENTESFEVTEVTEKKPKTKRETFVDDKGIERYSDNKRKVRVAKVRE